jgi:hypothetical protein
MSLITTVSSQTSLTSLSTNTSSTDSVWSNSERRVTSRTFSASQFTLLEELGSGSFGVVYRAVDKWVENKRTEKLWVLKLTLTSVLSKVVAVKKVSVLCILSVGKCERTVHLTGG